MGERGEEAEETDQRVTGEGQAVGWERWEEHKGRVTVMSVVGWVAWIGFCVVVGLGWVCACWLARGP